MNMPRDTPLDWTMPTLTLEINHPCKKASSMAVGWIKEIRWTLSLNRHVKTHSMNGIFASIGVDGVVSGANVGKYAIHGVSGC